MTNQTQSNALTTILPYTDLGNAKRYCRIFSGRYKFVTETNGWYSWDGKRWEPDHSCSIVYNFTNVLDDIENDLVAFEQAFENGQLNAEQHDELIKENTRWYKFSQSLGKINAAITLASSQKDIRISLADFDSKGMYLGTDNGVINLKTGELVVDDPNYFITKSVGTHYDPLATCPNWLSFLDTIFEGCQDKVDFLQRIAGQSLLGTAEKDKLIIMVGNGANGKSTVTDTLIDLLGDYALNTSAKAIIRTTANKDYHLAELHAKRLTVINESSKGAYLDEEMIKSLVDSGVIQARPIYQAPFSFQPVATPILTTNYRPRISADYSINRRILLLPFHYQIPEKERDPKFKQAVLMPELPGILNWALEGYREYAAQGLNPPKSILDATKEYFYENDRIGRFIDEHLIDNPSKREKLKDIKEVYSDWAMVNGYKEVSSDRVASELRQKGYRVEKRNNGLYHVLGVRFKTEADIKKESELDGLME